MGESQQSRIITMSTPTDTQDETALSEWTKFTDRARFIGGWNSIAAKIQYNAGRPPMHGKEF
jgi:hypothetical protein